MPYPLRFPETRKVYNMSSNRFYSSPSQIFWVCNALLQGRSINHLDEIKAVKGWRLAAIIFRLKSEFGWPIEGAYRGEENIKHYWLRPGTKRQSLKFPPSARTLVDGEVF